LLEPGPVTTVEQVVQINLTDKCTQKFDKQNILTYNKCNMQKIQRKQVSRYMDKNDKA
jgi:hypothetical protein